jgi:CRP-like cAMP-binding protein
VKQQKTMTPLESSALEALHQTMVGYHPIGSETRSQLQAICHCRRLEKGEILYPIGELPTHFAYVYTGLLRVFVTDDNGNEYNKKFFEEGSFPGSMTALLKSQPSRFTVDALEASLVVEIDHQGFRDLLQQRQDLMLYQIHYLERNWLLDKDAREVEIVQEDAALRYQRFLQDFPGLTERLPQYHIASHLGITPTQLSRIRKKT